VLAERLRKDFHLYHQLRYPGRRATFLSRASLLLGSKGLLLIFLHRLDHDWIAKRQGLTGLSRILGLLFDCSLIVLDFFVKILTKSDIWNGSEIEGGVYLSDGGHIILGAKRIGAGTLIHHNVTIGINPLYEDGKPEIGRNVWIGADSIIYGAVRIGDGATVAPGTVLSRCVHPRTLIQGNPPIIVRKDFDNRKLRQHRKDPFSQGIEASLLELNEKHPC
jgi:serine acetyltransferase